MKIEKTKSRNYNGKQYYKYRIILPEKLIKKAELKEGDKLKGEAKKGEIKLKK